MCVSILAGCTGENSGAKDEAGPGSDLFFTHQEVRESPEWVERLEAAKDAEQLATMPIATLSALNCLPIYELTEKQILQKSNG